MDVFAGGGDEKVANNEENNWESIKKQREKNGFAGGRG